MLDENGVELSEEEIMKDGLNHLAEACCFFYELESEEGIAMAFMADSLYRYVQAISNNDDPRARKDY
jgi:hypothetical protein